MYDFDSICSNQDNAPQNTPPIHLPHFKMRAGALALTVIVNLLLFYLAQAAGVWIVTSALRWEAAQQLYTTAVYLVAFFLPYAIYARLFQFPMRAIPHERPAAPVAASCVGISLGLSVAGIFLSMFLALLFILFRMQPPLPVLTFPSDPFALVLFLLNTTAVPALVEEYISRGIVMGSLRPFGDRFAIVISAMLFSLLHRNLLQIPSTFLLGLALGYFVIQTNSIWTGVIIHFCNNALAILLQYLSSGMNEKQAVLLQMVVFFIYLLAAGCGALYLLVIRRVKLSLPNAGRVEEKTLYRSFFLHFPVITLMLLFLWIIYLELQGGARI